MWTETFAFFMLSTWLEASNKNSDPMKKNILCFKKFRSVVFQIQVSGYSVICTCKMKKVQIYWKITKFIYIHFSFTKSQL